MTLKELQNFIKKEHERMVKRSKKSEGQEKRTLFRTIKLMEEIGELCEEILGFNATQRKEKIRKKNKEKLSEELADVLIVALLLAENLEIDAFKAVEKKIRKIDKRYK